MRRVILILCLSTGPLPAAELDGYLVLTSDYVFRGVTYSDGHFAAQLGGEASFDNGVYVGVWGTSIDIETAAGADRDLEIDYYLGYSFDVSSTLSLGMNAVAYTFPGARGAFDYDYQEYSLSANYTDRFWIEYSYSPDVFHTDRETHNFSVFTEWPLGPKFSSGAGVGYYDVSSLSGSGYTYWEIGVTRMFDRFDLDLRYHDADQWVPIFSNPDRVDARLVLSGKLRF